MHFGEYGTASWNNENYYKNDREINIAELKASVTRIADALFILTKNWNKIMKIIKGRDEQRT